MWALGGAYGAGRKARLGASFIKDVGCFNGASFEHDEHATCLQHIRESRGLHLELFTTDETADESLPKANDE